MKRLSVVIANYNYEFYVGAAIDSALALEWDDVEVVVVDDGSTDGSAAVIEGYADRVKVLFAENATQRVAANLGFVMTSGDVVIFLDSDDTLPCDLPARLAEAMTPCVSKVQFQMQRADDAGRSLGAPFPAYRPVPAAADIRHWASKTTAYPTPPGSGNAYARWFLDRIFPVGPGVGDSADSACLAAAPFFGDVVSVPGVVVMYRQHGNNDSNLMNDHRRFPREVVRARARWLFARRAVDPATEPIDERPLFRSRELLQLRIASRRLVPAEHPLPGDGWSRMLFDSVRAPFQVGPERPLHRAIVSAWCLAALLLPKAFAERLITKRYGNR
jgi:glycosyltransferase involved in cell wall biosynthesis